MSVASPSVLSIDGSGLSFGIVAARFNGKYVDALLANVLVCLDQAGVRRSGIETLRVPGSNEVPFGVQHLALTGKFDCCIGLGLLIRGATSHHELIGRAVADALHTVALATRVPVINGVVTVESVQQAEERSLGSLNRGSEFGRAALEMAALMRGRKSSQH